MGLKRAAGNMYPWVTHTHSHLAGTCPHECGYCYVQAMERRFGTGKFAGPVRLDERELAVNYGSGKVIFVEHLNDLFAEAVPDEWIRRILAHCVEFGGNANCYVFQTKNPVRVLDWLRAFPCRIMIGTTLESTSPLGNNAPTPQRRATGMDVLCRSFPNGSHPVALTSFVTIEPIQEPFDVPTMLSWLRGIRPTFVNIGADSKGHGLNEPSAEKVRALIAGVQEAGIEIRQKTNLARLLRLGGPEEAQQ